MNDTATCKVPVSATMQIINGKPVMTSAEYADIPADKLLAFLLERSGMAAKLECGNDEETEVTTY